ncbi:MAG: chalcone isomerase family protein [Pseudomonadota bacterium]|nr:chalcone isomerase family protein [Pseudomonadota bacterium]MDO7711337.1 chalcone isomerase family protein [Pseudomonadota bacterium]
MRLILFFISLFLMGLAQATPLIHPDFQPLRENIELKATATAKWLAFVSVYDVGLYASPNAKTSDLLHSKMPLSLEIHYRVGVKKQQLIEAAEVALARQNSEETRQKFKASVDELHHFYQDVEEGDRFRVDIKLDSGLALYFNDQLRYQNTSLDFANYYIGLWLAENPLSDKVRASLLNWSL